MIKGKILVSILTGAITLTSAGMATIITNPSASSEWLSQRFPAIYQQDFAEDDDSSQEEWFDTTVPDEAKLLVVTPTPETDTTTSASSVYDEVGDDERAGNTDDAGVGKTDAVASASVPAGESGSSGSTSSTGSSTSDVDVIASASKPAQATPVSTEGLISLEKAIEIARTRVGDATYKGVELDDDYPPVYELYFVKGETGYEVEIHAVNGTILDIDSETTYLEEHDDEDDEDDDEDDDDEDDERDDDEDDD